MSDHFHSMVQSAADVREEFHGQRAHAQPDAHIPESLWPELVVEGWERVHNHAISPDGTQLAFYWDRGSYSDLWVLSLADRSFPRRLSLNRPHVNWWEDEPPVWSPDGRWLVYGTYRENVSHLFVVASQGSAPRQLTELHADAAEAAFSPDGRQIAFSTQKGDVSQIAMVPFDGGWVFGMTLSGDECSAPVWSPDGHYIVFSASPQRGRKQNDIYLLPVVDHRPAGDPVRLTPDDNVECWYPICSPDGTCIALLSNESGFDEIWCMAPDGTRLQQLSRLRLDVEEFAWSPDGARLIALVNQQACDALYVIDAGTGHVQRVPCPPGNYSGPQWVRGQNAVVVGYDSPTLPPALYLCDVESGQLTQLTGSYAAALTHADYVMPTQVEYLSKDGWRIPALLYTPDNDTALRNGRRPAIVYPHGGPNVHYDLCWDPVRQYFAAKGYVVICPNYRGSTGYGRHFKEGNLLNWGVGDLNDCLWASQYLIEQAKVDPKRIAVWGQSYGGYLALLALAKDHQHRFKCGVCLYGDSHLKTSWATGDHSGRQDLEWQMGHPGQNAARYEDSSPINFVQNIQAPLLLMHGEQDQRVAYSESEQLITALRREGKTFEFCAYPDEAHGLIYSANALDALLRIERFLDWWLI